MGAMPAPIVPPVIIPDDWSVWAASDLHGQRRAADRLFAAAGLTDGANHWIAPAGTALVITGDVVDRGPDSLGLARRLVSLRAQAPAAGGMVAILQGNHEIQVLGGLDGEPMIFRALMAFGGGATLLAAGIRHEEWAGLSPAGLAARVDAVAPDFLPSLWTFAPYARWRDVLLVHGGPVPFQPLDRFAAGAERLWIREGFFASPELFPDADAWAAYRDAGFRRVVFGHTPVAEPTFSHGGRALNLDTWRGQCVTLAGLPTEADTDLRATRFLQEPVEPRAIADAPVTAEEIREIDDGMPAVVRAWWDLVEVPDRTGWPHRRREGGGRGSPGSTAVSSRGTGDRCARRRLRVPPRRRAGYRPGAGAAVVTGFSAPNGVMMATLNQPRKAPSMPPRMAGTIVRTGSRKFTSAGTLRPP